MSRACSACRALICILTVLILAGPTVGQPWEWGDAPENRLAYPATGVIGKFPTCRGGPAGDIRHNNFGAWLGPTMDRETTDGNGDNCPNFPPYDGDECFLDGDSGLMFPPAYTIRGGAVTPCVPGATGSVGPVNQVARWGQNIDIWIHNWMPNHEPYAMGYMNVLADWNQNGVWTDPGEHILGNWLVLAKYDGPVSGLVPTPPPFTIGPNSGYVWFRATITEGPVPVPWDGSGIFEDGETEDYLLRVDPPPTDDFGDAPEGVLAYPASGTAGQFPTCQTVGPAGWIQHTTSQIWLGMPPSLEADGNGGLCPGFNPYDNDECFADGVPFPPAYTIQGGVVVPCQRGQAYWLGQFCQTAAWGVNIDLLVNNGTTATAFVNVLMDWDQNGAWSGAPQCPFGPVPEHVLVDWAVPPGYAGRLSALAPASFPIGPQPGHVWARFSITERPVGTGWDGSGVFADGETEDLLLSIRGNEKLLDFGDAEDPPFATLLGSNGAVHTIAPGVMLGAVVDGEPDALTVYTDDRYPLAGPDDEDGVVFGRLVPGEPAAVTVTASVPGFLYAWIDFGCDQSWAQAGDQLFAGQVLNAGPNTLNFVVPAGIPACMVRSRFRFVPTAMPGLSFVGFGGDGEVEDHPVLISPNHDLGDAPDSTNSWGGSLTAYPRGGPPGVTANFPTVYGAGSPPYGPLHQRPIAVAFLGTAVSLEDEADVGPEEDLTSNIFALPGFDLSDNDGADDGILNMPPLPRCRTATFQYQVQVVNPPAQPFYVNAWFDWNRDGDWDDTLNCSPVVATPEWAVQNQQIAAGLAPGTYALTTTPFQPWHSAGNSKAIWMRITLSEQPWQPTPGVAGDGGSGPAAGYQFGETEDYYFTPLVRPDLDRDGDVDGADHGLFVSCFSGPTAAHNGTALCQQADLDGDNDVDNLDYGLFQACYSGANNPPDPACE